MQSMFFYRARTPEGNAVAGTMSAADPAAALGHLQARALFVTALHARETLPLSSKLQAGRSSRWALVLFFRSFATMFGAGVPIGESLRVSMEQCRDHTLRETLE